MFKKILLLCITLVTLFANAQLTPIPDSDFELKLVTLGIDTNGITGNILNTDAEAVVSLNVSNFGIEDLTGIEAFINITNLNCADNALLGTLDLSQNVLLEMLSCNNNQLTGLNVTQNIALTRLYCYTNSIHNIDITNNVLLEELDAFGNQFQSINLSQNPALLYFYCEENLLQSIDLSHNLNLIEFACFDNQLQNLDVSLNSHLSYLDAGQNQLTSLNLANGNNGNIEGADFNVETNNLTCIQVSDVAYANANWSIGTDPGVVFGLDCSPKTAIPDANFEDKLIALGIDTNGQTGDILNVDAEIVADLNISNANITNLTGLEAFVNLINLDFSNNIVNSVNLDGNPLLESLICYNNTLVALVPINNPQLNNIECRNNNLVQLLIHNNPLLLTLDCSFNNIVNLNLSFNTALTVLDCNVNQMNSLDVLSNIDLLTLLCGSNPLSTIDISQNVGLEILNAHNTNLLSLDTRANPSLNSVSIENNNIITLDFSLNPNLQYISCYSNSLTELDLSNNPLLTDVFCDGNNLTLLDMRNGNNSMIQDGQFITSNNPNLFCIYVSDLDYANANWSAFIDDIAAFALNEAACNAILGVDVEDNEVLSIYPNPAQNVLKFKTYKLIELITIYDIKGRRVLESTPLNNELSIENLDNGIYILDIKMDYQNVKYKIIKNK
jgi:hypothetical protein